MNQTNRRELLCTGGLLAAAASGNAALKALGAGPPAHTNKEGRWDHEYTFGHTMLFMEEYHRGTMEILGSLNAELGLIGELTSRAAHVIRGGGHRVDVYERRTHASLRAKGDTARQSRHYA